MTNREWVESLPDEKLANWVMSIRLLIPENERRDLYVHACQTQLCGWLKEERDADDE